MGNLRHRSRGWGALAWGPHSTSPPAAAFTEHQARARVRRSRTRIALAPPDTIKPRRRFACHLIGERKAAGRTGVNGPSSCVANSEPGLGLAER